MATWTRIYRSENKQIYVYFNNEDPDNYKAHAYEIFRVYKGEDSIKNLIRFIKDVGDNVLNESLIKEAKKGFVGA